MVQPASIICSCKLESHSLVQNMEEPVPARKRRLEDPDSDTAAKKKKNKDKSLKKEKKQKKERKEKKEKKENKEKKAKKTKKDRQEKSSEDHDAASPSNGGMATAAAAASEASPAPSKPPAAAAAAGKANKSGTSRVCMANLSFQIDEDKIGAALRECGTVTSVDWLLEAGTGKFYGKAIVDMGSADAAARAVGMNGSKIMGRPVRVEYAQPRKGQEQDKKKQHRTKLGNKPLGCTTLFLGNLDFQVTRETLDKFFEDCGAIKDVRMVKDRATEQFKGCAFVEFWETASVDKAALLGGSELLGRKVRMSFQG